MILPLNTERRAECFLSWLDLQDVEYRRCTDPSAPFEYAKVTVPRHDGFEINTMYRVYHTESGEWGVTFTAGLSGLVRRFCNATRLRNRRSAL